ncbi:MFS transporter [Siminovitchia sp. 179-K 8D1 HS]|uniref:MFS transporter n=1 Tax=Siminovitchia sp. 179-K 8D1 HS TaxID=3142385 RepID=UPI0039A3E9F8
MKYQLDPKQTRLAGLSSVIGTTVEWYDFFIYGTMAALVFPKLFFPSDDPFVSLMLSFATFFVGFVARPLGAIFFGHFGDRIGRKTTLVITILLMGFSTFAIGFVPSYDQIGILAPIILVTLRVIQGFSIGGEWGGAVLLAMEWGETNKRGLMASLPQMGAPFGLVLSSAVTSLLIAISGDGFEIWGWRVVFGLSLILVLLGLFIRLNVMETPYFKEVLEKKDIPKLPVIEVFAKFPKEVVSGMLARVVSDIAFYIFITFVVSYGTSYLELDDSVFINATLIGALFAGAAVPLFGYLSDRIGRNKIYRYGIIAVILWAFPYFALLNTKNVFLIFLSIILSLVIWSSMFATISAIIAESFPSRIRYTGASVTFQLTGIIGGGLAPMIAIRLLQSFNTSAAVSLYLIAAAIISIVALHFLKDHTGKNLD